MRHHKWESSYHEINEKGQLESINLIQLDLYNVEKGLLEPKSWSRFLRVAFKCIWDWMVFGGATRTSTFDDCEKTFPFINWINFYTIKPITPTTIVVVATFRMLERFSPKLDRGFLVVYQLFIHSKFLLLKGEANPFSHDRARCSLIAVVVSDASAAPLCSPSCARRVLSLRGSGFSPNFRPRCTPPLQVSRSRTCDGSPYRDRETTVRWNGVAAATGSAFECRPARTSQYLFHFSFRRFFFIEFFRAQQKYMRKQTSNERRRWSIPERACVHAPIMLHVGVEKKNGSAILCWLETSIRHFQSFGGLKVFLLISRGCRLGFSEGLVNQKSKAMNNAGVI